MDVCGPPRFSFDSSEEEEVVEGVHLPPHKEEEEDTIIAWEVGDTHGKKHLVCMGGNGEVQGEEEEEEKKSGENPPGAKEHVSVKGGAPPPFWGSLSDWAGGGEEGGGPSHGTTSAKRSLRLAVMRIHCTPPQDHCHHVTSLDCGGPSTIPAASSLLCWGGGVVVVVSQPFHHPPVISRHTHSYNSSGGSHTTGHEEEGGGGGGWGVVKAPPAPTSDAESGVDEVEKEGDGEAIHRFFFLFFCFFCFGGGGAAGKPDSNRLFRPSAAPSPAMASALSSSAHQCCPASKTYHQSRLSRMAVEGPTGSASPPWW